MHVSPEIEQKIAHKAAIYGSPENVLVAALQALEDKEQLNEERQAVLEGLNSGDSIPADQVFNQLRKRYGADS